MFNKIFLIVFICIFFFGNVFCCFMDDPKFLFDNIIVKTFDDVGAVWQVQFPKIDIAKYTINNDWLNPWLQQNYPNNQTAQIWYKTINKQNIQGCIATFPLTINCQFTGFADDNNKITRFCLLYWGKNKRWTVLKDIKNPTFEVVSNTGDKKSLFGKYVIESSYGFKPGQILFITCYFQSQSGKKTHTSLNDLIKTKPYDTQGCIKIGVISNVKPK